MQDIQQKYFTASFLKTFLKALTINTLLVVLKLLLIIINCSIFVHPLLSLYSFDFDHTVLFRHLTSLSYTYLFLFLTLLLVIHILS